MSDPTPKQLLEKLVGKRVFLSTRCGTFNQQDGQIQQVFQDFFLFLTVDDRQQDNTPLRNWVWMSNVGIIRESPKVTAETIEIER